MKGSAAIFLCLLGLSAAYEDKSIVQWLKDNSYTTLINALNITGLLYELDNGGPYTVFVPTDAVFYKLGINELTSLLQDPTKTKLIIEYHVVNGFVLSSMIATSGPVDEPTLNSETLRIEATGGPSSYGLLLNNVSRVSPGNKDILLKNGVVQPIDTILIPQNIPDITISQQLLTQDGEFSDLFLALILANLTDVLDNGDYTLFAPVDSAFGVYKDTLLNPSAPNAKQVYQEVLKYHVVPGGRLSSQLSDGQILPTLHGTTLTVKIDSNGVSINDGTVIDADILATNGVIHGIDKILIPSDINQIAQG